jgi:asparagine synthase (glutamine-hydrolysing)
MASYPAAFVTHGGLSRAPARALLHGRLPDTIALRQSKMAFSPTYDAMLQAHAAQAIERLADQRAAGAGEWLDLAWLERALRVAGQGVRLSTDAAFRLQCTAMAAEFFRWWRDTARQA